MVKNLNLLKLNFKKKLSCKYSCFESPFFCCKILMFSPLLNRHIFCDLFLRFQKLHVFSFSQFLDLNVKS